MDELDGRVVTERLVQVNSVVVVEPDGQPLHNGSGIRERTDANVVALEGSHECLGHAIALGAFDGCGPGFEADVAGELPSVFGDVAAPVVAEPIDGTGQLVDETEPLLDGSDDEVLHVFTGDAAGRSNETHGFAVAAVQRKGDADALAIVATDLETVGAPAAVAFVHRDAAIMSAGLTARMTLQEQAVLLHHPPDPFMVRGWCPSLLRSLASQDGMNAAIAVGRHIGDHGLDVRQ